MSEPAVQLFQSWWTRCVGPGLSRSPFASIDPRFPTIPIGSWLWDDAHWRDPGMLSLLWCCIVPQGPCPSSPVEQHHLWWAGLIWQRVRGGTCTVHACSLYSRLTRLICLGTWIKTRGSGLMWIKSCDFSGIKEKDKLFLLDAPLSHRALRVCKWSLLELAIVFFGCARIVTVALHIFIIAQWREHWIVHEIDWWGKKLFFCLAVLVLSAL